MMDLAPLDPRNWYELVKSMIKDLKANQFKSELERTKAYSNLYETLCFIHSDYIRMLQQAYDDLRFGEKSDLLLETVKTELKKARSRHSPDRTMLKFGAHDLVLSTDDLNERRFLTSLVWYFQYSDNEGYVLRTLSDVDLEFLAVRRHTGDKAWDSATSRLLFELDGTGSLEEAEQLLADCIDAVALRFSTVATSYARIEMVKRFGAATPSSRYSRQASLKKEPLS